MIKRATVFLLLAAVGLLFAVLVVGYVQDAELNTTARYYAERSAGDLGAANVVTAIIVTYRGLDTLGEVTVVFLAASIVGLILSGSRAREGSLELPPVGELLTVGSRLVAPIILVCGAYVFTNGHLTPGGGFQGGAILASGTLLLLLADPLRRFAHGLIDTVESLAGGFYVFLGILGLVIAGGFLDNRFLPLGDFGALFSAGAIPVIYTLVGLKVGAEFSAILAQLSATERQ